MARQEWVVIVTIHEAMQELSSFVERNRPFFPKLNLTTPRPLDAKIFPDEWRQVRPPQNGMYVIFRSESQEMVYVGSPQVSNVASMSISVPASRGRGPAVNVISPIWRWLRSGLGWRRKRRISCAGETS